MQKITAPIVLSDKGPEVANLQDALRFLVEKGKLIISTEQDKHALEALAKERREQFFGDSATLPLVRLFQEQARLPPAGEVDQATADALNKLLDELGAFEQPSSTDSVVRGRITRADGTGVGGLIVRARDRDLRTFQPLGNEAVTHADGKWEIRYSQKTLSSAEKGTVDLVVRVFPAGTAADPDKPLLESPVWFNAPLDAEVNLRLPGSTAPISEFERYISALRPLLVGQAADGSDLPLEALTEADIDFIVAQISPSDP